MYGSSLRKGHSPRRGPIRFGDLFLVKRFMLSTHGWTQAAARWALNITNTFKTISRFLNIWRLLPVCSVRLRMRRASGDPELSSRLWPNLGALASLEAILSSHNTLSHVYITFLRLHAINISCGTSISTDILNHCILETYLDLNVFGRIETLFD